MRMRRIILSSVVSKYLTFFLHYVINDRIFGEEVNYGKLNVCFEFLCNFVSELSLVKKSNVHRC
jgi:hypothetical protein